MLQVKTVNIRMGAIHVGNKKKIRMNCFAQDQTGHSDLLFRLPLRPIYSRLLFYGGIDYNRQP